MFFENNSIYKSSTEEALQMLHGTIISQQAIRLPWGRSPADKQVSVFNGVVVVKGNLNYDANSYEVFILLWCKMEGGFNPNNHIQINGMGWNGTYYGMD